MTPEWRVPLVPDCRISIILATFDPDLLPESAHQVIILIGDRGIPKSWRHMDGFSSHT
jgi:hypothetical protein